MAQLHDRPAVPFDRLFWWSLWLSLGFHSLAVGAITLIFVYQPSRHLPPMLLESYGDSDVEGFDVGVVSLDPGAYARGDEHTPGGDDAPLPPAGEPLPPPRPPSPPTPTAVEEKLPASPPLSEALPVPTVEEAPLPAVAPIEQPKPALVTPRVPEPERPAEPTSPLVRVALLAVNSGKGDVPKSDPLPGASGGAKMKIGTPSAGGIVGSRQGVEMIDRTPPPYPAEARLRGIQGKTMVLVAISADGLVTEATIHQSSGYTILDNAALEYARTRRYRPARQDNIPVPTSVLHPVGFWLTASR